MFSRSLLYTVGRVGYRRGVSHTSKITDSLVNNSRHLNRGQKRRFTTNSNNNNTNGGILAINREEQRSHNYAIYAAGAILPLTYVLWKNKEEYSAAEKKEASFKEKIFGNYENRIRQMSAPEKVFEYFASHTSPSGEKLMTAADFIRVITPYDFSAEGDVGLNGSKHNNSHNDDACRHVEKIFKSIDQNGDGMISFSEFIFFTTLLAIPPKYVRIAFRLFDLDGNGDVDAGEFKAMMRLLREKNPWARAQRSNQQEIEQAGLYPIFFGKNNDKRLSFETFEKFLFDLREAILHMQFDVLTECPHHVIDTITAKKFAMSLVSYANLKDFPAYIERAELLDTSTTRITFEEFHAFNQALDYLEEIDFAIQSFIALGDPFSPDQFKRAAKAVANLDISQNILDVVFTVFDKDGDGKLDYSEFVGILKGKNSYGTNKPRDLGIQRFGRCFMQCWKSEISNRQGHINY